MSGAGHGIGLSGDKQPESGARDGIYGTEQHLSRAGYGIYGAEQPISGPRGHCLHWYSACSPWLCKLT